MNEEQIRVLTNLTIIDGINDGPQHNQAIVISGRHIEWVGPVDSVPEYSDSTVEDWNGYTLLPGMIDAHVHFSSGGGMNPADRLHVPETFSHYQIVSNMNKTLDAGVTSVRDLAGADYAAALAVEKGLVRGPRMVCAIYPLGPTAGHSDFRTLSVPFGDYSENEFMIADDVATARKWTRELIRVGAGAIKVMATGGVWSPRDAPEHVGLGIEEMRAIVEEANKRDMYVAAHAQGAEGINNALKAGIMSIEHGYLIDDEGIELMLQTGAWLVPTLLTGTTPPDPVKATPYAFEKKNRVRAQLQINVAKAFAAGVKVAMGTDSGVVPHGDNLKELGIMVDLGLSPEKALKAGTIEAAKLLGIDNLVGTIEVGKEADLILTQVDPLKNIHGLGNPDAIEQVIQAGAIVKNLRD